MLAQIFGKNTFSSVIGLPKFVTQLLIDGKFVNSKSGKTFKTVNPATEEVLAEVQEGDKEDADLAIQAAREAFENGPWRRMDPYERSKLIYKLADLMEKNKDELALLESLDNGKPLELAKIVDLNLSIKTMRYYAGWADKIHGETLPVNGPYFGYTRSEPVGVCGQIIPWNFPLLMAIWKLGPVLACGCTSILKPAEQTPLSALRLGELILEAGIPKGVVNIIPGYGPTAGRALVTSPYVDKIAFTGSNEVGMEIMRTAHQNCLKRISLELGGKSPLIIMDDADLKIAVKLSADAIFFNSGQVCSAGSRVFVHEKIYDKFVKMKAEEAQKIITGDPLKQDTNLGPLVDKDQLNKYLYYVKKGQEEGAHLVTGGKTKEGKGFFVEPTVFSKVTDNMEIAKAEIFGPVSSILKFKTISEVIKRANSSSFGLASGVITNNIDNVMQFANGLRQGSVWINCYNVLETTTPFGGFRNSGIGRDLGKSALKNYIEEKTVVIRRPKEALP